MLHFMKKVLYPLIIAFLLMVYPPSPVHASCPPPFAKIESISPHNSCLYISDKTKFCGGSIEIVNNCSESYYVNGKELLPRLATFPRLSQQNWTVTIHDANNTETVTVRGTSTEGNFHAKPYVDKSRYTAKPTSFSRLLFFIVPLALLIAIIAIIVRLKKRKGKAQRT